MVANWDMWLHDLVRTSHCLFLPSQYVRRNNLNIQVEISRAQLQRRTQFIQSKV